MATVAHAGSTVVVEIDAGRAPLATLVGAVDAALRSDLAGVVVRVAIRDGDPRRDALARLCGDDARVAVVAPAEAAPTAGLRFTMPPRARPQPRTLAQIATLIRADRLGSVDVPLPGRFGGRSARGGKVRAEAAGSGSRRVRAADVGLRSVSSRREPGPPPPGTLAEERAEHLRHRARSATMRARMDRNAHRLARERLQVRHEIARVRLAERRLGRSGAGEWVRWRLRAVVRRVAAVPGLIASGLRTARSFVRRARRFAVDRWRSRGSE